MMMAWLFFILMAVLLVGALAPAFIGKARSEEDEEIATYFTQIDTIRSDADMPQEDADAAVLALQRQILAKQKADEGATKPLPWNGGLILACIIVLGSAIYISQYPSSLSTRMVFSPPIDSVEAGPDRNAQLRLLVSQLEQRLSTDRAEDPQGWRLYGRSLITLGDYDRAVEAYDRAVALSEGDTELLDERRRALEFIETRRLTNSSGAMAGPTEQDVLDAEALSPEDRQAMIFGMVDSLATRLEVTPDDPQGWVRLLRARRVLGQTDQLETDIQTIRDVYSDDPTVAQQILDASSDSQP